MKKSILFSSIAATTCLLIQNSASAGWINVSGEFKLEAGPLPGPWQSTTSNAANHWTNNVSGYSNYAYTSTAMNAENNIFTTYSVINPHPMGHHSLVSGKLTFAVNEKSNLYITGGGEVGIPGTIAWGGRTLEVKCIQANSTYTMGTEGGLYTLMPDNLYQVSQTLYARGNGPMTVWMEMSLTPVPAPAASALLALAGFVSRRRRA